MDFRTLETLLEKGIFTIRLNRPAKKNAMSLEMMVEVTKTFESAAKNKDVSFVVLTGKGDFYSSGMDMSPDNAIPGDGPKSPESVSQIGRDFVASFIDFPKLLIAVVNGPAVGIAFTTLALCDIVYCNSKAFLWAPFTAHGLSAEGCSSYLFPRMIGNVKANEVLQFGKKLTAQEAKEYNLVTEIYNPGEFDTVIMPRIQKLNEDLSTESIIANKKLFRQWQAAKLHQVNRAEWKELENRVQSEDFANAILKFMNKKSRSSNKL